MSETTFDPFSPTPSSAPAVTAPKNGRRKRGPNKTASPKAIATAPKPTGPGRTKPKVRAKRAAPTKALKLDLLEVMPALAGLKHEDAATLTICVSHLQNVPKASRARVVAALGRIFS